MSINSLEGVSAIYVKPYQKVENKRPYGYDEDLGIFTQEQAMKDFKPGLIMPKKEESSAASKVVKTVGVLAGLVAAIAFRGKLKGLAQKAVKYVKPLVDKVIAKTPKSIKDLAKNGINKASKLFKTIAAKTPDSVKKFVKNGAAKVVQYVDKGAAYLKNTKAYDFVKSLFTKVK